MDPTKLDAERVAAAPGFSGRFTPRLTAALPDEWFAKESMTLLAPDGQANIIASSEPVSDDIDSTKYATIQGELLSAEFPGYRQLSFDPIDVLGGRSGYIRRFTWIPPDGNPVVQLQLYYVEDGRGYTATATTPVSQFGRYERQLRQILAGLQLVDWSARSGS